MDIKRVRLYNPKFKKPEPEVEAIKINFLKARYLRLSIRHKLGILISLISLTNFIVPHQAYASEVPGGFMGPMIFPIMVKFSYIDYLNFQLSKLYEKEQMQQSLDRQIELGIKVKEYLNDQESPLARYTSTLIQLPNWKKIIALSNAESGLCKHYPIQKSNCWGIGGSNLWYMGSNLEEGILSMNRFLDTYPNNLAVKYSQMSFKQMNGLYKQPPAQHWVVNNQTVYDDLTAIENSL
jgi:hypothetical protein